MISPWTNIEIPKAIPIDSRSTDKLLSAYDRKPVLW
jgi:hypothetical protein